MAKAIASCERDMSHPNQAQNTLFTQGVNLMNHERVLREVEGGLRNRIEVFRVKISVLGLKDVDECGRLLMAISELEGILNIIRYGMVDDDLGGQQNV